MESKQRERELKLIGGSTQKGLLNLAILLSVKL